MAKVKILGKEYELDFTLVSMRRIEKRCGDIDNLSEWLFKGEKSESLSRACYVAGDMINGAIHRHNVEIGFGLADGEKQEFLSDELINALPDILTLQEVVEVQKAILTTMGVAEDVDLPDTTDPDLLEVESVKKN